MPITPENSRSLLDGAPAPIDVDLDASDIADTTPDVTPQDFDPVAFLAGVRPQRRAVILYSRGDLIADMEIAATRIERMSDDDPDLNDAIDEFEALRARFRASGAWWEVEARSQDWQDEARRTAAEALGVSKADYDADMLHPAQRQRILLEQLAGQIVTPSGVSAETLAAMVAVAETEVAKLVVAMTLVNSRLAQKSDVLDVDFSQRRSGNRRQRRSSAPSK